jgi:hypothetical protein
MSRYLATLTAVGLTLLLLVRAPAGEPGSLSPVHLDNVNSEADEDDPFVTADGSALYYASNRGGTFAILIARRTRKGWTSGQPLASVNRKDADVRSPFLARDGKLYFATNEIPDPKFKEFKNYDIKWTVAMRAPLILPGISEPEDELHPWVTASGREFYFSRKMKDGWKLFVADGPALGPIGNAREVGFPAGFHHATLSASGLVMYLQGPLEKGRWGLFRSARTKAGAAWSKPEPLITLNHPGGPRGDLSPFLSADGTSLYFASDRPGGKGGLDLWMIPTAQLKAKGK